MLAGAACGTRWRGSVQLLWRLTIARFDAFWDSTHPHVLLLLDDLSQCVSLLAAIRNSVALYPSTSRGFFSLPVSCGPIRVHMA